MHTATMREAFKAKGVSPRRFQAPKPDRPRAPEPEKRVANETLPLRSGVGFTLIFNCPRSFVPEGIEVSSKDEDSDQRTAAEKPKEDPKSGICFNNMRVDLDGLMSRCFVDSINVHERKGYCRVYVNCIIAAGGDGFDLWRGAYEDFIRKAMRGVWKRAVLADRPDGSTSLDLRYVGGDAEVKMFFAVKS